MAGHQRHNQKSPEKIARQRSKVQPAPLGPVALPELSAPGLLQRAVTHPRLVTPANAQMLQRAFGNWAVTRLLQRSPGRVPIQARLTVNPVGDQYEQEADQVAEQVIGQIRAPQAQAVQCQEEKEPQTKSLLQREAEDAETLRMQPMAKVIQRLPGSSGMAIAPELESAIQQARGGGQPMSSDVREPMERAFGASFSGVRVHTHAGADALNQSLQARSFTTGQDIFFRSGEYGPGSSKGQELIAHELTHVVQQMGGQGRRTGGEAVMRKSVKVSGGTFQTDPQTSLLSPSSSKYKNAGELVYAPYKATDQTGAVMKLRFRPDYKLKPKKGTKAPPTKVSLVQTVNDTIQYNSAPLSRPAAGFGLRTTDKGTAIDQVLYDKKGKLVSLDPRYSEERMKESEALTEKGATVKGSGGCSVTSEEPALWSQGALLRDMPGVEKPGLGKITGGMQFEVAALIDAQTKDGYKRFFGGSIKWGWKMKTERTPEIDPTDIEEVNGGEPSAEFFKAVEAWNEMQVPEKMGDDTAKKQKPFQLPGKGGSILS